MEMGCWWPNLRQMWLSGQETVWRSSPDSSCNASGCSGFYGEGSSALECPSAGCQSIPPQGSGSPGRPQQMAWLLFAQRAVRSHFPCQEQPNPADARQQKVELSHANFTHPHGWKGRKLSKDWKPYSNIPRHNWISGLFTPSQPRCY